MTLNHPGRGIQRKTVHLVHTERRGSHDKGHHTIRDRCSRHCQNQLRLPDDLRQGALCFRGARGLNSDVLIKQQQDQERNRQQCRQPDERAGIQWQALKVAESPANFRPQQRGNNTGEHKNGETTWHSVGCHRFRNRETELLHEGDVNTDAVSSKHKQQKRLPANRKRR